MEMYLSRGMAGLALMTTIMTIRTFRGAAKILAKVRISGPLCKKAHMLHRIISKPTKSSCDYHTTYPSTGA